MKIKISKKNNAIVEYAVSFLSRYLNKRKRQVFAAALVLYSLLLFLAGILVHESEVIEEVIKPSIKKRGAFMKHLARGVFLARPEKITIDIAHEDFQKLEYKRREALEIHKLVVEEDDFVPARIRHRDRTVRVRLRLKGDHTDHLEGDKWSFRIKVRGNETLFGMKQFSIQHPRTRNYIYEWLYHEMLKREGLAFLRYDFIEVTLNGRDLGIYALEEFFQKHLIENSRFREGPIIRFGESLMWDELLQRGQILNSGTYLSSAIDAFQSARTLEDPVKRGQFIRAISLLESFRKGELKTGDVFDRDKLARFLAISDLMGAQHATIWMNMRFYLNPVTARLEPIGFDGNSGISIDTISLKSDDAYTSERQKGVLESFYTALASDREFFRQYISELERVSRPDYLESFFNEVKEELEDKLNILYKEFPHYSFSKDVFYHNRHIIDVTLNPVKVLHAYFKAGNSDSIELELGNIQLMDAEVLSVSYRDSTILEPSETITLPAKTAFQPVEYKDLRFFFPEGFEWGTDKNISDLSLNCRIFGTTKDRAEGVLPHRHLDEAYLDGDLLRQAPNAQEFEFLIVDDEAGKIIILPGEWDLAKDLVIPEGFMLICSEGTRIRLSNEANIVSYSPIYFIGTKEEPVVIHSEDSTAQGMLVMAGGQRNTLKNVVFKNLAVPRRPGWEITGAVTFYESPVEIVSCKFLRNTSEDGLNIIRSEFSIDDTLFSNSFSDALDADFTKGTITNSSFIECGNDAIDISGSVVEIGDVFIYGAGDKGISIGELSNGGIVRAEIEKSNIAVAVKDSSAVDISDARFSDCGVGLAIYRKKPEYGPAEIVAASLRLKDIERDYLVEEGSRLSLDKVDIQSNERDVYKLLYGER